MRAGIFRKFLFVFSSVPFLGHAISCEQWFVKSRIKPGPACLTTCAIHPVDMGTFECPTQCEKFCTQSTTSPSNYVLGSLVDLYPALTEAERKLAKSDPKRALKAYSLSWDAEKVCKQTFPVSDTNDESDACRHFLWAGLLVQDMGVDEARKYLDAHEDEPGQPQRERAMDMANNRAALLAAEKLVAQKKFSKESMMSRFLDELKGNKLIVIHPKVKNWKELK